MNTQFLRFQAIMPFRGRVLAAADKGAARFGQRRCSRWSVRWQGSRQLAHLIRDGLAFLMELHQAAGCGAPEGPARRVPQQAVPPRSVLRVQELRHLSVALRAGNGEQSLVEGLPDGSRGAAPAE